MTLTEYHAALKAQGVKEGLKLCMVCPMCGTVQNGEDLIKAGAGQTLGDVEGFIGFSCIGRWTHGRPPPKKEERGTQVGCNWTLGGLFQFHELEVITPDGERHPRFAVATPEQAQAHLNEVKP